MTSSRPGPPGDRPLRVLFVSTDEAEASDIRDLVARMPVRLEVDWARSFEAAYSRLTQGRYDAHLVDARLGERDGIDLLRAYLQAGGVAPVLVVGRSADRVVDLSAMEGGAAGFLAVDHLDPELLERSIRYYERHLERYLD